jgi:hypothetical protein
MLYQATFQRDDSIACALSIHLHPRYSTLASVRIFDTDFIDRFTVPIADAEALPRRGYNRIHPHLFPAYLQA